MTERTLPDNGTIRRVENATIESYETYLKDRHRPPSRGRAWHSHVIKIDEQIFSFLGLGFRKWAYKTDTISFEWQWESSQRWRNIDPDTFEARDKNGVEVERGHRGSKPRRTATTRAPVSRREWRGSTLGVGVHTYEDRPNSQIGGLPLKLVRDCLRQAHDGYISIEDILEHLQQNWWHEFIEDLLSLGVIKRNNRNYARNNFHLSREKQLYGVQVPAMPDFSRPAQTFFDHLLAEGYIEFKGNEGHRTTIKGQALKMTKLVSRMNRAKADALLKGVLERVAAINADPDMQHWVTEVRVFGSYLTDTDELGDLDIALGYEQRPIPEGDEFREAIEAFAAKQGKEYLSYTDLLYLPETVMLQRVKWRSPYISVHNVRELAKLGLTAGASTHSRRQRGTNDCQLELLAEDRGVGRDVLGIQLGDGLSRSPAYHPTADRRSRG